eukprot:CAMPEP_0170253906 /NCGR_PEP_ID=MMETSP0116_2-20130129/26797_1 /TAXON_ID=400756 /ORGANISM="Durinskia baltica, Strain CSIRO CS-38" /LENGTH=314 /DNA_ID=CAMNT_0010504897 /DNA_START=86 /DNA_END=1028 /DNA_ORIENTATION=+
MAPIAGAAVFVGTALVSYANSKRRRVTEDAVAKLRAEAMCAKRTSRGLRHRLMQSDKKLKALAEDHRLLKEQVASLRGEILIMKAAQTEAKETQAGALFELRKDMRSKVSRASQKAEQGASALQGKISQLKKSIAMCRSELLAQIATVSEKSASEIAAVKTARTKQAKALTNAHELLRDEMAKATSSQLASMKSAIIAHIASEDAVLKANLDALKNSLRQHVEEMDRWHKVRSGQMLNRPVLGVRVRRGRDWNGGKDDDGADKTGVTIPGNPYDGWVRVRWQGGHENLCRVGYGGKFDLTVFDVAPTAGHVTHG